MLKQLHYAIQTGQVDLAVSIIKQQPELLDTEYPPELETSQGTPLHQAFAVDNNQMITALLKLGPKRPNALNNESKTPLALFEPKEDLENNLAFFEAVNAGCLVDPANGQAAATNNIAISILSGIRSLDGKGIAHEFLELLAQELKEYDVAPHIPNINRNPKGFCGYILTAATAVEITNRTLTSESYSHEDREIPPFILEMIQKQGLNWEKNLSDILKEGIDMPSIRDTTTEFVYRTLMANAARKSLGHLPLADEKLSEHRNGTGLGEVLIGSNAVLAVMGNRSITDIMQVAKAYHRHRNQILHRITDIDEDMIAEAKQRKKTQTISEPQNEWPPLLAEQTILQVPASILADQQLPAETKSINITELTTRKALAEEGKKQSHCVESYDSSCKAGKSRIFSIRTDKGEILSTLEIGCKDGLKIVQNRGFHNAVVPHIADLSAKWLLKSLKLGELKQNTELKAERKTSTNSAIPGFILDIGRVPTQENCEENFNIFRELKTAKGKPFLAPDYQHMSLNELDDAFQFSKHYREGLGISKTQATEIGKHQLDHYQRSVEKIKNVIEFPAH